MTSVIVGAGMKTHFANVLLIMLNKSPGPAHAVYFGTYEAVKEFAGGNAQDGKHHPLAAGTKSFL